jgi:uncharacterized iron-regulated membrane protein
MAFDGVTGAPLRGTIERTASGSFFAAMTGLHEGLFAHAYVRALYVVAGLTGAGLIATGLVRWSVKRRSADSSRHLGHTAVDVLNLGTIIGLPIGIAGYFWSNRLLPLDTPARAAWEVHTLFIVWGLTYLYAATRARKRAWGEMCAFAAAMFCLLPVLNALTTDRHVGTTIRQGDWGLAGFDISTAVVGLFFAALVRATWRERKAA